MYQLDEEFKKSLNLGDLPEADRETLYAAVAKEVIERANEQLSRNLGEEKVDEIGEITGGDQQKVWDFLNANLPTWEDSAEFAQYKAAFGEDLSVEQFNDVARQFAAGKWFQMNAPDYDQVVEASRNAVKDELSRRTAAIAKNMKK